MNLQLFFVNLRLVVLINNLLFIDRVQIFVLLKLNYELMLLLSF